MDYLDQLKELLNAPDDEPKKPKELPNPNCLVSLGSLYGVLEKTHALESSPEGLDLEDMHLCTECRNLRGGVCTVAQPGGAVSAMRGYRPAPDIRHRCGGYAARGAAA